MSWKQKEHSLTKTYEFNDFTEAIAFVNEVAKLSEKAGHHPDIDIRYNKVHLSLSTHDMGGVVTKQDLDLADQIEQL